jgi:hypothetical protein
MENLHIEKGRTTPAVIFNTDGELRIEGNSICENSIAFYTGPLEWLKEFESTNPKKITFHVNLEYFNSSSSMLLIKVFTQLQQIVKSGAETNIIWYYPEEDTEMIEAGQNFSRIAKLPFNFCVANSKN